MMLTTLLLSSVLVSSTPLSPVNDGNFTGNLALLDSTTCPESLCDEQGLEVTFRFFDNNLVVGKKMNLLSADGAFWRHEHEFKVAYKNGTMHVADVFFFQNHGEDIFAGLQETVEIRRDDSAKASTCVCAYGTFAHAER